MRIPIRLAAAIACAASGLALAQGPTPASQERATSPQSAADQKRAFEALQDEYDEAVQAFRVELRQYNNDVKSNPDLKAPEPPQARYFARFRELADAGQVDAKVWVLQNFAHLGLEGDAAKAEKKARIDSVFTAAPTDAHLAALARVLSADAAGKGVLAPEDAMAFLDKIVATAKDEETQASAAMMKATAYDLRTEEGRKAGLAALKEIEARWPKTRAGKQAGGKAFAAEHLNVGQTAPEIVGADVDGNAMKLSDFRGKVVVIDFWGFW